MTTSTALTTVASSTNTNVIPVDFRTPVVVDFADASTPRSEIAKRLAAEAVEASSKAVTGDKKAGTLRLIAAGRADLFNLNPYLVRIRKDWNSRDMSNPENLEHIDTLARSIAEIGVQQPLTVSLEGNEVFVTDGHSRLLATFRAIEVYGAEIKSIPARAEGRFASEADRIMSQIVRNSGKPLTVLEQGAVFVKLVAFGWNAQQIASKAGVGVIRVTQVLDLMATASDTIKALVSSGKVSATQAADTIRAANGDVEAAERTLTDAVDIAVSAGKTKATAKHVKAAQSDAGGETKLSLKAAIRAVFDASTTEVDTTSDDDTVTITLSAADWRRLATAAGL